MTQKDVLGNPIKETETMTEQQQQTIEGSIENGHQYINLGQSLMVDSQINQETVAGTSLFESKIQSVIKPGRGSTEKLNKYGGRYSNVATRNMKFEKFIDTIFQSRMGTDDVKDEIVKYVQALETSYTEAIKDLKVIVEKEKDNKRKL